MLWIHTHERPEDVQRISALDKGSLVHHVLERFIGEQVAVPRGDRIRPHQRWSPAHHARLDEIVDDVFTDYEKRGLTGRRLLWQLDQSTIRRDLHTFLDADDRYRAEQRAVPEHAELAFGRDGGTPVAIRLGPDRDLTFKGSADRIDLTEDGALVVLDYKTGRDDDYTGLVGDPVVNGTRLQLPIYALAAQARFGPMPARAAYWFLNERSGFAQIGYQVDDTRLARFHDVLEVIVDGIEGGSFPARPGDEDTRYHSFKNCGYCDFDAICPPDRDRAWERVRDAPQVARYVRLSEGDDE